MQESLLKKLVDAIKYDQTIKRDILVKGYTKYLHVNIKENRLQVTRTHLYPSNYVGSTFYSKQGTIDYKKLANEYENILTDIAQKNESGNTNFKSVQVVVRKK